MTSTNRHTSCPDAGASDPEDWSWPLGTAEAILNPTWGSKLKNADQSRCFLAMRPASKRKADMTMTAPKHPVEAPLEAARRLAPVIAKRAPEVETARRMPHDLVDELATAGCFCVLTPTSHGGLGADLLSALKMFETLARADASVAWTVMIGGTSWIDLVGLPRATF